MVGLPAAILIQWGMEDEGYLKNLIDAGTGKNRQREEKHMADELKLQDLEQVSGGKFGEASGKGKTNTVQKGDTLSSIADKFDTTTAILVVLNADILVANARKYGKTPVNPVEYADYIYEGEVLRLP